MPENNYSVEQEKHLGTVRNIVDQLAELEELQKRAKQPIYNLNCAMDQAVSDISLDNYPPYHILEGRLKEAVTAAIKQGLDKDPFIMQIKDLAFS